MHMYNATRPMKGSELLSVAHATEVILMLGESDRKISDFLSITSNFYTVERLMDMLEENGIVRPVEMERIRGKWYALTPTGRIVAEHLKRACDAIDSSE